MPVIEITQTVDARGLSCPMPIVKTAQADEDRCRPGPTVELLATDARVDQGRRRVVQGDRQRACIEQTSDGAVYRFVIRRK